MADVGFVVSWNLSLLSNKTASVDSAMLPVYCYRENKICTILVSTGFNSFFFFSFYLGEILLY